MLLALWLAAGVLLLAHAPAWADIHDEFRACMYEFYPRLRKAGATTAVTPPDQFCLGFAYWSGTGPVPKDPAHSARWWKQAAERGHPGAQTMLAYQYGRGLRVVRSDADAVRLLRAAIAQGYGDGMFNLGRLRARGQGVPKSDLESRQWLEKGLRAGNVDAAIALRDEREQALNKPAADQAGAAYQAYRAGDLPRAVQLYRAAADAGHAAAQETLGTLLRTGQGVPRDPAAAMRLYRLARPTAATAGPRRRSASPSRWERAWPGAGPRPTRGASRAPGSSTGSASIAWAATISSASGWRTTASRRSGSSSARRTRGTGSRSSSRGGSG